MKRRPCYLIAAAAVALFLPAVPANATHVQCGQTLTQSTVLDSDIQCGSEADSTGLIIGASDVVLRLNGYTIRAGVNGGADGIVSNTNPPSARIHIKRGAVEGFQRGVSLVTSDSVVLRVNVAIPGGVSATGIGMTGGNNNFVSRSVVDVTTFTDGGGGAPAIWVEGDDAYVWGSVVRGFPYSGIYTYGERSRIVNNQVENCAEDTVGTTVGIEADADTTGAVVNRNTVTNCTGGVIANSSPGAGGAKVALNQTNGGRTGITVTDANAMVRSNFATEASDTGIAITEPGTRVKDNNATNNGNYGIVAQGGAVDLGGNTASGNGDGTNPQCVNVQCGSP